AGHHARLEPRVAPVDLVGDGGQEVGRGPVLPRVAAFAPPFGGERLAQLDDAGDAGAGAVVAPLVGEGEVWRAAVCRAVFLDDVGPAVFVESLQDFVNRAHGSLL